MKKERDLHHALLSLFQSFELYLLVLFQLLSNYAHILGIHKEAALHLCDLVTVYTSSLLCGTVTLQTVWCDDKFPLAVGSLFKVAACSADSTLDRISESLPLNVA